MNSIHSILDSLTRQKARHLGTRFGALLLALVLFAVSSGPGITSAAQKPAATKSPSTTRLVVVLVVDQFRFDFLSRFNSSFGARGFRRLANQGTFFTNAHYDYVPTFTACGHAAIFTGSFPAYNGIVGNTWFDRESAKLRIMVSDDAAKIVRTTGLTSSSTPPKEPPGVSPRNMIGVTIGDQMRLATEFRSKVVAVSLKDRSAILPAGQRPSGAFWFDAETGSFASSDYYSKSLPGWVNQFNTTTRPDKYFGSKWELPAGSPAPAASSKGFPYTVNGGAEKPGPEFYTAFQSTPFSSEYLADFAAAAIAGESLGADDIPDLLSVSFSGPDLIGHEHGPDSSEVADTYARLDRVIANLLDNVDRRVGLANTLVVLTGDHGVSPAPEDMQARGFAAGRILSRDVIGAANRAMTSRFGEGKWVTAFANDQLYLDRNLIARQKIDPAEAERVAGEGALTVGGIMDFFTRTQILEGRMQDGPVSRRVMHGFYRMRSGDVWLITRPFNFIVEAIYRTTHGTAWGYDAHVPIVFFGGGVAAARNPVQCAPTDIAATVADWLSIEAPPNSVGRVLPLRNR